MPRGRPYAGRPAGGARRRGRTPVADRRRRRSGSGATASGSSAGSRPRRRAHGRAADDVDRVRPVGRPPVAPPAGRLALAGQDGRQEQRLGRDRVEELLELGLAWAATPRRTRGRAAVGGERDVKARPTATVAAIEAALKSTGTPVTRAGQSRGRGSTATTARRTGAGVPRSGSRPRRFQRDVQGCVLHDAAGVWRSHAAQVEETTKLPKGLALKAKTGVITGTPKLRGTFSFTIRVQDDAEEGRAQDQDQGVHHRRALTRIQL